MVHHFHRSSFRLLEVLSIVAAITSLQVRAWLSSSVGPDSKLLIKRDFTVCNVLNYGAKADKETDIAPALLAAFADCKYDGLVYVPEGDYGMSSNAGFEGGSNWGLQIDGVIYRTGQMHGTMLTFYNSSNFGIFSRNGQGAIQGNGYEYHRQGNLKGPRLIRITQCEKFEVHDLLLIDSPSFHLNLIDCHQAEVYNINIKGADHGGLDGIDVSGSNIYIHDVEVTNRDECVTIKSPASHILVENVHCNWSGGCSIGSLGSGTKVAHITYRKVYSNNCNSMFFIKSNGGDGWVYDILLEDFVGYNNAYGLFIDQYWGKRAADPGPGVSISGVYANGWKGTIAGDKNGRGPLAVICADDAPCTNINIQNFAMWTEKGNSVLYRCRSAFGYGGFCLKTAAWPFTPWAYPTTFMYDKNPPSGYDSYPKMDDDLQASVGFDQPIELRPMPKTFFPNGE